MSVFGLASRRRWRPRFLESGRAWAFALIVSLVAVPAAARIYRYYDRPVPRSTFAPWSFPNRAGARLRQADLPSYGGESAGIHFHVTLTISVNGAPVAVPAHIGLVPRISAVHTHGSDGILHVELRSRKSKVSLGDFFTMWGVKLTSSCIGAYCKPTYEILVRVDGIDYQRDQRKIPLQTSSSIELTIRAASDAP